LRTLSSAIPLPKQGPAWQRWLARHPLQYKLPAGVATDLPALLEAGDASWVELAALHLSNVMDGATADDVPSVVAWEWACSYPPYLEERDPHFHHQDARTKRRVREASGIRVRASQVESTQVHASARRAYYVPTPSWSSAVLPTRFFGLLLGSFEATQARAVPPRSRQRGLQKESYGGSKGPPKQADS